jgi:hypothetical protein
LLRSWQTADCSGETGVVLAPDTGDGTGRRHLQGGRPQHEVETELCTIADVFGKINSIKTNPDCEAGCAGGTGICPNDWYPTGSDECSGACGAVFEPFVSSSCCICISGAYCSWRLFQYYTLLTHSSHPFAVRTACQCQCQCHVYRTVGPVRGDAYGSWDGWYG